MHVMVGLRALCFFILMAMLYACGGGEKPGGETTPITEPAKPTSTSSEPQFKKEGSLAFISAKGDTLQKIDIEIASNDPERTQGLMYRTTIDERTGMLFIFDRAEMQSFWMKNTPSSLDIMFIAPDMTILNIHEFTQPFAETNYPSTGPASLVLEVKGGYCKKHSIKPGDKISYSIIES